MLTRTRTFPISFDKSQIWQIFHSTLFIVCIQFSMDERMRTIWICFQASQPASQRGREDALVPLGGSKDSNHPDTERSRARKGGT